MTSKIAGLRLKKEDIVVFELGGGGGYGDPREREPERVRLDALRGYISREAAERDYAVILRDDLSIDEKATEALRSGEGCIMTIRIGIDVGGTFTDVTGFDELKGEVCLIRKYSSNPADPMSVMTQICDDLLSDYGASGVSMILHGSTAALNCMLEDKGVKVGLITTDGFRDVYEIGRQWRGDDVFNLYAPAPKMLTTRDLIHEARGRLDYKGEVVEPLDRADIEAATRELVAANVEAIAVCFLFSYTNPAHEREAAEIIKTIAPDVYVSLSCDVNPEWREYERTASTVANAYIGPVVSRYLQGLEALVRARFFPLVAP